MYICKYIHDIHDIANRSSGLKQRKQMRSFPVVVGLIDISFSSFYLLVTCLVACFSFFLYNCLLTLSSLDILKTKLRWSVHLVFKQFSLLPFSVVLGVSCKYTVSLSLHWNCAVAEICIIYMFQLWVIEVSIVQILVMLSALMDIQTMLETLISFRMQCWLFRMTFVTEIHIMTVAWQRFLFGILFLFITVVQNLTLLPFK